jgi:hypothetical protein
MGENMASSCPICESASASMSGNAVSGYQVDCPRCGSFMVDALARTHADALGLSDRWRVSAWLVSEKPDVLTPALLDQAKNSRPPPLQRRARRLLAALADDADAKYSVTFEDERYKRYLSIGWCRDDEELVFLLDRVMRQEFGWLAEVIEPRFLGSMEPLDSCVLSAKGLLELEAGHPADSKIGFCAMWFDEALTPFYRLVIEQGVRACGYDPLRLDHKEHNNNIHDEIIASIRGAKFVIAEMTGHRGGVYFEAGFAHGLGLPVIYMVQEDDKDNVHFDVQSQNFILWSPADLPDARKRLENRIRATLGQGPLNPDRR